MYRLPQDIINRIKIKYPGIENLEEIINYIFEEIREKSITDGIIDGRKRMKEYEYYYTHYLEGYENSRVIVTGDVLGIRETRRIVCEYMMKKDDYLTTANFADEIGRYCYPVDVHAHSIDAEDDTEGLYARGYEKGQSYGISYRCLLPKKTTNTGQRAPAVRSQQTHSSFMTAPSPATRPTIRRALFGAAAAKTTLRSSRDAPLTTTALKTSAARSGSI